MPLITDVAKEANVSLSTVSRVLNRREPVRAETRERVEGVMKRLGYEPLVRRSSLAEAPVQGAGLNGKHRLIFLYASQVAKNEEVSSYCHQLIAGARVELGEIHPLAVLGRVEQDMMFRRQLEAREFDGVIAYGSERLDGYTSQLTAAGVSVVRFNHMPKFGEHGCVTVDHQNGARQVLDHVSNLGHRRLAFIHLDKGPPAWSTLQIQSALLDAATAHPCEVVHMGATRKLKPFQDIRQFCQQALEQNATVWFTTDRLAMRCIETLAQMGVRVPEDISVIGFDNLGLSTARGQELTTVGYDKPLMGQLAAKLLRQMIESEGKLCWLVSGVATHLCKGQTCDRPKS